MSFGRIRSIIIGIVVIVMTLGCFTACMEKKSNRSSRTNDNDDDTVVETSLTDATTSSSVQHTEKPEPTATLTPTPTPAPTATPIPTMTPTPVPTPTSTPIPTSTPKPTNTPKPTSLKYDKAYVQEWPDFSNYYLFNTSTKKTVRFSTTTDPAYPYYGTYKGTFKNGQKITVTVKDGDEKWQDTIKVKPDAIELDTGTNGYFVEFKSTSVSEALKYLK